MKRTIWKYEIPFVQTGHKVEIEMPLGSRILHVGDQAPPNSPPDHPVTIWVEVDPDEKERPIKHWFHIYGTGHAMRFGHDYLGTVVRAPFVWHLYHNCEGNKYADGGY